MANPDKRLIPQKRTSTSKAGKNRFQVTHHLAALPIKQQVQKADNIVDTCNGCLSKSCSRLPWGAAYFLPPLQLFKPSPNLDRPFRHGDSRTRRGRGLHEG